MKAMATKEQVKKIAKKLKVSHLAAYMAARKVTHTKPAPAASKSFRGQELSRELLRGVSKLLPNA